MFDRIYSFNPEASDCRRLTSFRSYSVTCSPCLSQSAQINVDIIASRSAPSGCACLYGPATADLLPRSLGQARQTLSSSIVWHEPRVLALCASFIEAGEGYHRYPSQPPKSKETPVLSMVSRPTTTPGWRGVYFTNRGGDQSFHNLRLRNMLAHLKNLR